ncbi:hypothetical protein LPJ53_003334 [Coemansia erecta]|uniref:Transferase n=1 Tax=Coemansia erecta TaxID=147472 RepID=A0A9W7Y2B4_9FUNG|nr:hypothetical protein LPJ53_003334 [Coemansia erecta]
MNGSDISVNPALSGTLFLCNNSVGVDYSPAPVQVGVTCFKVKCTYSQLEAAAFNQNQFPEIFSGLTSPTPSIEGLPVLRAAVFELGCGSVAVGIRCHHILMDAAAAVAVCGEISKAMRDPLYKPVEFWHDRQVVHKLLSAQERGEPAIEQHLQDVDKKQPLVSIAEAECQCHQIHVSAQMIQQLKKLSNAASNNSLVMALFWRTWTRTLVQLGATSQFTYTGGPVDLRSRAQHLDLDRYLGNFVLPHATFATKDFVMQSTLAEVAESLRQHFQAVSLPLLRRIADNVERGMPDVLAEIATGDSPTLAFSNMVRLPMHDVDFGMDPRKQSADSVQLCSFEAPLMMFAISDGQGGILTNVVLPGAVKNAFVADEEFGRYATFKY